MSGDPEQEYFSDGITEDIITDLSNVSALAVASSNSAFAYKGQHVDIGKVARELKVSHVLEGSVRKAGGRIRINAQLIFGATNNHVWAQRFDRDASDIFAIQDEISQAIVKALRLKLLPEEKKAIERRGTDSVKAHDLYMMARQTYITGQESDIRSAEAITRLCTRATEVDPNYAQAWALLAVGYFKLQRLQGGKCDEGIAAADRALSLEPELAEAHAVKAQILLQDGDSAASAVEVGIALELDPDSYEVNRSAARLNYQLKKFGDAIRCYEKAIVLAEADVNSAAMLMSCYTAIGDAANTHRTAELMLKRAEAVLARDPNNASVLGYSVEALVVLGEIERAKARMERALLIDPANFNMRYNFACMMTIRLHDEEAAFELLGPLFEIMPESFMGYTMADPDLESLHGDPRWQAMVASAEARLAAAKSAAPAPVEGS
jgi:adenylate cyclase